jgi:hypothetical protein
MEASRKVEGGKYVSLALTDDDATLTGDFFLYPETAIDDLEAAIAANRDDPAAVEAAIEDALADDDVELLGATPAVIAALVAEVTDGE